MADERSWAALVGIGAAAAAMIVLCGGLGLLVDKGLDTLPVFVMIGLAVGIASAGVYVYTVFRDSLRGPSNQ